MHTNCLSLRATEVYTNARVHTTKQRAFYGGTGDTGRTQERDRGKVEEGRFTVVIFCLFLGRLTSNVQSVSHLTPNITVRAATLR